MVGYVETTRPPALVQHFSDADPEGCQGVLQSALQIADVIRCRKRALEFSNHELPVLCIYDIQKRTSPELGDFNFVTKPAGCTNQISGTVAQGGSAACKQKF